MTGIAISFKLGSTLYSLSDGTRSLAECNLTMNGRKVLFPYQLLGATYAKVADLGNQRNSISFDANRMVDFSNVLFSDEAKAAVFCFDLMETIKGVGKLKVEITGSATYTRWLGNACVESADLLSLNGVTLTHRFTVNGGAVSTSEPT